MKELLLKLPIHKFCSFIQVYPTADSFRSLKISKFAKVDFYRRNVK